MLSLTQCRSKQLTSPALLLIMPRILPLLRHPWRDSLGRIANFAERLDARGMHDEH